MMISQPTVSCQSYADNGEYKASQNSFQDILDFGKELFCEGLGEECDMDIVNSVWPSSWEEAQVVLRRVDLRILKNTLFAFVEKRPDVENQERKSMFIVENGI